jgi:hypothetical protein
VQHLAGDLEDFSDTSKEDAASEVEKLVSFRMIRNLVRYRLLEESGRSRPLHYQFKISFCAQGSRDLSQMEDSLLSGIYFTEEV